MLFVKKKHKSNGDLSLWGILVEDDWLRLDFKDCFVWVR